MKKLSFIFVLLLLLSPLRAEATKQVIVAGQFDPPSRTSVEYCAFMGGNYLWLTEAFAKGRCSARGNIYGLKVELSSVPGIGKEWTISLRTQAFFDQPLSVTISGEDLVGFDFAHSIPVTPGVILTWKSTPFNTPASTSIKYTVYFDSVLPGETIFVGGTPTNETTLKFLCLNGTDPGFTEFEREIVFPTPGTVIDLYVGSHILPGPGETFTYITRKDSSSQTVVCTTSDLETASDDIFADTGHSFAVAAGENVTLAMLPSAGANNAKHYYGLTFIPDNIGEFIIAMSSDDVGANGEYSQLVAHDTTWNSTETPMKQLSHAMLIKKICCEQKDVTGRFGTWFQTLRVNGLNSALTCGIGGLTATTCNASSNIAISDDDLLNTKLTLTGGGTGRVRHISYLGFIEPDDFIGANF